jgi:hypothetical protein
VIGISCSECLFAAVNREHAPRILGLLGCTTGATAQCTGATYQPVCREGRCE